MRTRIFQDKLCESLRKFANNTAIKYGEKEVSYAELDDRSDQIFRWIVSKVIGREAFVGILTFDRATLITSIIAVLKAGGIFVPLDTAIPVGRLEQMVNIVNVRILFTDRETIREYASSALLKNESIEFVLIDDLLENRKEPGFVNRPAIRYSPQDKIYLYFRDHR
jgi:non-ribosomal peptide synthetase component F